MGKDMKSCFILILTMCIEQVIFLSDLKINSLKSHTYCVYLFSRKNCKYHVTETWQGSIEGTPWFILCYHSNHLDTGWGTKTHSNTSCRPKYWNQVSSRFCLQTPSLCQPHAFSWDKLFCFLLQNPSGPRSNISTLHPCSLTGMHLDN